MEEDSRSLIWINLTILAIIAAFMVAVSWVISWGDNEPAGAGLVLVSLGSLCIGAAVGFLYSAFGDEEEKFSSLFKILNGVIGGFTTADLLNPEGVIRKILGSLARSSNSDTGIVAMVVAMFGMIGFLCLYVNRRVYINPAIANSEARLVELGATYFGDGGLPEQRSEFVRLGNQLMKKGEEKLKKERSSYRLLLYAKALYAAGYYSTAETLLKECQKRDPGNSDALHYLGNVLIKQGIEFDKAGKDVEAEEKMKAATTLLEQLTTMKQARIVSWKFLGYAALWNDQKYELAADSSKTYLEQMPGDADAVLNLACASARLAWDPEGKVINEKRKKETLDSIERLLLLNPNAVDTIRKLTKPDEEFEHAKDDTDFKATAGL